MLTQAHYINLRRSERLITFNVKNLLALQLQSSLRFGIGELPTYWIAHTSNAIAIYQFNGVV